MHNKLSQGFYSNSHFLILCSSLLGRAGDIYTNMYFPIQESFSLYTCSKISPIWVIPWKLPVLYPFVGNCSWKMLAKQHITQRGVVKYVSWMERPFLLSIFWVFFFFFLSCFSPTSLISSLLPFLTPAFPLKMITRILRDERNPLILPSGLSLSLEVE